MARITSTLLLLTATLLPLAEATRKGKEYGVQLRRYWGDKHKPPSGTSGASSLTPGSGINVEARQTADGGWAYIPNYDFAGCNAFITYDDSGNPVLLSEGAKVDLEFYGDGWHLVKTEKGSCCGRGTTTDGLTVVVKHTGETRQACGPEIWQFSDTTANGGNAIKRCNNTIGNQQTPINFQTVDAPETAFTPGSPAGTFYPINTHPNQAGFDFSTEELQRLQFSSTQCLGEFTPLAGTWEVEFADPHCVQTVTVGGQVYRLKQFHVHNAEHQVNGLYYPLEIHMVHFRYNPQTGEDDANQPLVVGAWLSPGPNDNYFFKRFQEAYSNHEEGIIMNPYQTVIPVSNSYWQYRGSLTTPPCQTGDNNYVRWFMLKTPVIMSYAQAYFYSAYFNDLTKSYNAQNNRPTQKVLSSTQVYTYGPQPDCYKY